MFDQPAFLGQVPIKRMGEPQARLPFPSEVIYRHSNPDGSRKRCGNCNFFMPEQNLCTLHGPDVVVPENMYCIPSGSLIFANGSLKKVEQVVQGDKVLTHKNRWRNVLDVISREYDGDLVLVKSTGAKSLLLTPEHSVYVIRKRTKWDNEAGRNWTPSPFRDIFDPEWIPASELKLHDLVLFASPMEVEGGESVIRWKTSTIPVNKDLARFAGYYVAEGCAVETNNTVLISFGNHEQHYIDDVVALGKKIFGLNGIIRDWKESRAVQVIFNSKDLMKLCSAEFGKGCEVKRLPDWLMRQPVDITKHALIGAWRGDGCFSEVPGARKEDLNRWRTSYISVSHILCEQLADLARRNGFSTAIQFYPKPYRMDGCDRLPYSCISLNDQYDQVAFRDLVLDMNEDAKGSARKRRQDGLWRRSIRSIEIIKYHGAVYNFSVEEDQSYTLAGGTVHNCNYHIYGSPADTMDTDLLYVKPELSGLRRAGGGLSCDACVYYRETTPDQAGNCNGVANPDTGKPPAQVEARGICSRQKSI